MVKAAGVGVVGYVEASLGFYIHDGFNTLKSCACTCTHINRGPKHGIGLCCVIAMI